MTEIMDKRLRAELFRDRLLTAMRTEQVNQSQLARAIGVDRSTVSQLVKGEGARLPNAQVVGAVASALGVSADWLLGLSERPESAQALADFALDVAQASRALVDEQVFEWHREAAGYKIRHVPATLPDMLKTREFVAWEYALHLGRTAEQAIQASEERLAWMRAAPSDYEIAMPLHELQSFARSDGYYAGLPTDLRARQLAHMSHLAQSLYPRLRLYLFDARQLFSAPLTVFGPLMAALYVGQHYVVFRDTQRVGDMTVQFDTLVREAQLDARASIQMLGELCEAQ